MTHRLFTSAFPRIALALLSLALLASLAKGQPATDADAAAPFIKQGLAAEQKLDSKTALSLFLQADQARPNDAYILQKIAREYSDSIVDTPDIAQKKHLAEQALAYSERAVALDPKNPVNVLSLAVCHGTLATYSDTRTKIKYSRLVKEEAERALALDPNYAWAHHILGRWNYEVASLGFTTRLIVRLVYGGLPDASYAQAIAELQRAVALEPNVLSHRVDLGFAYLAAGKKSEARASFKSALALPPTEKHDALDQARAQAALKAL